MSTCTDPRSLSEYLIAYGPIVASVAIAVFAGMQWRLAQKNFKLALYQRRFAIFHKLQQFHMDFGKRVVALAWGKQQFEDAVREMNSYVHEAEFLFDPKDGIPGAIIRAIKLMSPSDNRHAYDAQAIEEAMAELRHRLTPYLDFTKADQSVIRTIASWLRAKDAK